MKTRAERSPLKLTPLRDPGQSVREWTIDLIFGRLAPFLWLMTLGWALMVQAWVSQTFGWQLSAEGYTVLAIGFSALFLLQFFHVSKKVEALQLGRDGERLVGEYLEQQLMRQGARIVHDVPADGFNLDHVVIAPQGLFVIETKTHTKPRHGEARISFAADGTLRIGGLKPDRDPVVQIRASSRWLSELLSEKTGQPIRARGVVVFPGWFIDPMARDWLRHGYPCVLEPKALPAFIAHEPCILSEREVDMFANHLTRYVRDRENAQRKA